MVSRLKFGLGVPLLSQKLRFAKLEIILLASPLRVNMINFLTVLFPQVRCSIIPNFRLIM